MDNKAAIIKVRDPYINGVCVHNILTILQHKSTVRHHHFFIMKSAHFAETLHLKKRNTRPTDVGVGKHVYTCCKAR